MASDEKEQLSEADYLKGTPKVYVLMMDPEGNACEEFWLHSNTEYTSPRVTEGIFMRFGDDIRKLLAGMFKVSDYIDGSNYVADDNE